MVGLYYVSLLSAVASLPHCPSFVFTDMGCMCRPCDIYLQIPCYRFCFKCSLIFQVKLEYTQTHNFMCVHPFPICCQFSLVRKAPVSIFVLQVCWQRVLICVKAPLVFRCLRERFEVDRVPVFSFLIPHLEDAMSCPSCF